jgi:hypothetical protein
MTWPFHDGWSRLVAPEAIEHTGTATERVSTKPMTDSDAWPDGSVDYQRHSCVNGSSATAVF